MYESESEKMKKSLAGWSLIFTNALEHLVECGFIQLRIGARVKVTDRKDSYRKTGPFIHLIGKFDYEFE